MATRTGRGCCFDARKRRRSRRKGVNRAFLAAKIRCRQSKSSKKTTQTAKVVVLTYRSAPGARTKRSAGCTPMAAKKVCVGSGYKSPKFVIDPYIQLRRSAASESTPLSLLLPQGRALQPFPAALRRLQIAHFLSCCQQSYSPRCC